MGRRREDGKLSLRSVRPASGQAAVTDTGYNANRSILAILISQLA
jgi:hypothetical protein